MTTDAGFSVAHPWRRVAGYAIDSAVSGVPFLAFALRRRHPPLHRRGLTFPVGSMAVDAAYTVGTTTLFGRTLGQRLMGLRVVDQVSGGPPGWRQAAVRWAIPAVGQLGAVWLAPVPLSRLSKLEKLEPEATRLRQEHRGDRKKRNEALMSLYKERGLDPFGSFGSFVLRVVPGVAYHALVCGGVLRAPTRQGLHDRAANTLVVQR